MKTEEIIDRLRHPHKYYKKSAAQNAAAQADAAHGRAASASSLPSWAVPSLAACILVIVFVTWLFVLNAKNKADNLTQALEPKQIEGLTYEAADFNPSKNVTYVQINEGSDKTRRLFNIYSTAPK